MEVVGEWCGSRSSVSGSRVRGSQATTHRTLVNRRLVGAWQMPWNAKPDAGRLAPGIPPSNFWVSDPNGLDQVRREATGAYS
jgi:hypothetical protein